MLEPPAPGGDRAQRRARGEPGQHGFAQRAIEDDRTVQNPSELRPEHRDRDGRIVFVTGDDGGEVTGDDVGAYPVPVSVTVWTPLPSFPCSSHVADTVPTDVGANCTVSSIEVFGAI